MCSFVFIFCVPTLLALRYRKTCYHDIILFTLKHLGMFILTAMFSFSWFNNVSSSEYMCVLLKWFLIDV